MNKDELFALHQKTCEQALALMRKKNADYTGDSSSPFANFMQSETLTGVDARLGLLMRVGDKMQRLRSFITQGELKVSQESVDDSIVDIINYMILLLGMFREKQSIRPVVPMLNWQDMLKKKPQPPLSFDDL